MATGNPFDDLVPRPDPVQNVSGDPVPVPLPGTLVDPAATATEALSTPAVLPEPVRQPLPGTVVFGNDLPRTAAPVPVPPPAGIAPATPGGWDDPQQYIEAIRGVIPGAVKSAGTVLQAPDVAVARAQLGAAAFGKNQLSVMDRIDRGEIVPEMEDAAGYQHMTPEQRAQARAGVERAQQAFSPTPVQERPMFKAGEAVQDYAKTLFPAKPGYENSFGRQVGEGGGSLVFGIPIAAVFGPVVGGTTFAAMGVGEATQRAVEYDRKERAAGRPGLTQEQITAAGLLGVGPGVTDLAPVEVLLGRLPVRIPEVLRRPLAQGIARVGTQAVIEGIQEGGQGFLQDLIAREIYNPQQVLGENFRNEAEVGAAVGGIAEVFRQLGAGMVRSAAGRRGPGQSAPDQPQPTPDAPQQPQERQEPQLPWLPPEAVATPPEPPPAAPEAAAPAKRSRHAAPAAPATPANPFADLVPANQNDLQPEGVSPVAAATAEPTPPAPTGQETGQPETVTLYRGEAPGAESDPMRPSRAGQNWTTNLENAQAYAGEGGNVYAVTVPADRVGEMQTSQIRPDEVRLPADLADRSRWQPVPAQPTRQAAEPDNKPAMPGAPQPGLAPAAPLAPPMKVVTPDGSMEIEAVPEVVELADLKRAEGALQPRDRSRAEYAQEARERAANLDPMRLQPSRTSDTGAPIVAADGTVLSGNGRTMSIEQAYRDRTLAGIADTYRRSLGKAAEGMREPVLIMRATNLAPDQAARFADLSNRTGIAQMSATERALRDAQAIGLDGIALYEGGAFDAPQNQRFMRDFMTRAVTAAEMPSVSRDGQLTLEGVARMRAAVLAAAYGDADVLSRMLESTDDNVRSITSGLLDAAPKIVQLRAGIASGEVDPGMDPVPALMEGVRTISDLRSRKVPVQQWLAQTDAFGRDPVVEAWVKSFYYDDSNRPKRQEKVALLLTDYATEAVLHRPGGLFADETTTADVLGVARRKNDADEADLFAPAGAVGESVPKGRKGAAGRPNGAGRKRSGEGDDILAAIQTAPSQLDRVARAILRDARTFEEGLRAEGATPQQIADAVNRRYQSAVTAEQVASGNVWWRRMAGETEANDLVDRSNVDLGVSPELADALLTQNPMTEGQAAPIDLNAKPAQPQRTQGVEGGASPGPRLTAEQREAALALSQQGLDSTRIAQELQSQFGTYVRPDLVESVVSRAKSDREQAATRERSAKQAAERRRAFYESPENREAKSAMMREIMARPEMQAWLRERGQQLAASRGQTVWTPDMVEALGRPEMRTMTAQQAADVLKSEFGEAAAKLSPNAVRQKRADLGYSYAGDKFFAASPFTPEMEARLATPEYRNMNSDRAAAALKSEFGAAAERITPASIRNKRAGNAALSATSNSRTNAFSWSPEADRRLSELMVSARNPAERAAALNKEFGGPGVPALTPKAVSKRWDKIKDATLRAQGEEPMFAVGGWDPRSWLDWIKGNPDVGREDATTGRGTGEEGSREASGRKPSPAGVGREGAGPDASGGADGVRQSFRVRDFVGRVIDAPPNGAGLRQQYLFLHPPKVTWPFVKNAATTLRNLDHGVPNWVAKAHVSEVEPGVWQVMSVKVRKKQAADGLTPEFLDAAQAELGEIRPPDKMPADAYQAWRNWERQGSRWATSSVDGYVEYKGSYYAPDLIRLMQETARDIATSDPDVETRNKARRDYNDLSDLVDKLPPDDDGPLFAIGGSPAPTPDKEFWDAVKPLDAQASGEFGKALDGWIGGPHDAVEMGQQFGLMRPGPLEGMSAAELDKAAKPVRDMLRERYGNTITVYRGEDGGGQSTGRLNRLFSYTTDRRIAERFAGAGREAKVFSEDEINAAERQFAETGEATLGRITFRRDPEWGGIDMFNRGGEHITDTPSIRAWAESENADANERNAQRQQALSRVREVVLPVDDVIWATDRFNQREIIAKPRLVAPEAPADRDAYIDEAEYRRLIRDAYIDRNTGEVKASSRHVPVTAEIPPVGSWRISNLKGIYGHEVEHLIKVPLADLQLPELDSAGKLDPMKRGDDERYAQWIKEGRRPPPIEVLQTDRGNLRVMDGHRRALAAKRAGLNEIEAWVSYAVPTGKVGSNGDPIMTGLTYEMANPEGQEFLAAIQAFHGTGSDFDRFQLGANPQGQSGSREGPLGVWSANDADVATIFADWASKGGHTPPRVIPLHLDFKNPLVVRSYGEIKDIVDKHTQFARPGMVVGGRQIRMVDDKIDYEAARQSLIDMGYDGIILKDTLTDSPDGVRRIDQYVAIKPGTVRNALTGDAMYAVGSPGLDMSPEAKKQRLQSMGFDTSTPLYHARRSKEQFAEFKTGLPTKNNLGFLGNVETRRSAVFLSNSDDFASQYGDWVEPYYVRGNIVPLTRDVRLDFADSIDALGQDREIWSAVKHGRDDWALFDGEVGDRFKSWSQERGVDGYKFDEWTDRSSGDGEVGGETVAIFDPKNIRSVDATGDPLQESSANLMAAVNGELGAKRDQAIRRRASQSISNGKSFGIEPEVVGEVLGHAQRYAGMFPEGTPIAALEKIQPYRNFADTNVVRLSFRTTDGDIAHVNAKWNQVLSLRNGVFPATLPDGTQVSLVGFVRFDATGYSDQSFRGELAHEAVHVLRRRGILGDRLLVDLANHSNSLGVMNQGLRDYLTTIGNPNASAQDNDSVNSVYRRLYAGRSDASDALRQESAAHMLELYVHGAITAEQVAPVKPILDAILDGSIWRGEQGEMQQGELQLEPAAAAQSIDEQRAKAQREGFDTSVDYWHGTGRDIGTGFDLRKAQDKEGRRRGVGLGKGKIYLEPNREGASNWAMAAPERGLGNQPNVIGPLWVRGPMIDEDAYHAEFERQSGGRPIYDSTLSMEERDALIAKTDKEVKSQGYRGIQTVYRNRDGSVAEIGQTAIFDPRDIRHANADFDAERRGSSDLMAAAQKGKTRLAALHNLSAENLAFADKMGGIAVPSIAVVKEGMGIEDGSFGDITLIGRKDLADPAKNPVFDADAWTSRFPRADYKAVPSAKAQKFVDALRPYAAKFENTMSMHSVWDEMVNKPEPERAVQTLLSSEAAQAMFLDQVKGKAIEPVMRPATASMRNPWVAMPAFQKFLKDRPQGWSSHDLRKGTPEWEEMSAAAREALREYIFNTARSQEDAQDVMEIMMESHFDETGQLPFGGPMTFLSDDIKKVGKREVDKNKSRERLEKALKPHAVEFKGWVEKQIVPLYGEPRIKVAGRFEPYTLENIVRVMSGGPKVQGQEEHMTFGPGKARADAAKRISSVEEARNRAEWQMGSSEDVKAARERANKLLEDFRNAVVPHNKYVRANSGDRHSFGSTWDALDGSMRALARWARGRQDATNLRAALAREDFANVPQDVLDLGVEAGKAFLEAPVPYFEAKPQRAVSLNEFAGAVIPSNASAETKALLDKHGIPYKTYKKDSPTAQSEAAAKFAQQLAKKGEDTLFAAQRSRMMEQDSLGYYSQALEAARGLKQAKGTPEQMLAQLKSAGVKDAEIEATNLRSFLEGKRSVTRDEIVAHLEGNRVGLTEKRYGDMPDNIDELRRRVDALQAKYDALPDDVGVPLRARVAEALGLFNSGGRGSADVWLRQERNSRGQYASEASARAAAKDGDMVYEMNPQTVDKSFRSGHFPEPNIVGHLMSSMVKHEGRPVYLIDQIQSDWGQKLRDGGVRDEAKIADLKRRLDEADAAVVEAMKSYNVHAENQSPANRRKTAIIAAMGRPDLERAGRNAELIAAELKTAEAATPGDPLVNTTDQWVNTTLRRAIRQAAEADADYIAIPSGDTVLSYNPGDDAGMRGFYGSRTSEGIVPKNLRKLLEKIDKDAAKPTRVEKLQTPTKGMAGSGFTLFPLTDRVKQAVLDDGQPLFAFGGINARTADKEALARAEQMERDGALREDIYGQTGWFRGPDKAWRFEIDDSKAMTAGTHQKRSLNYDHGLKHEGALPEVLEHPVLHEAYPELAGVHANMRADLKGAYGTYADGQQAFGDGSIQVSDGWDDFRGTVSLDAEAKRSTLLHEVQHALQQGENFARGANPRQFVDDIADARYDERELKQKIERIENKHSDEARFIVAKAKSEGGEHADFVKKAYAWWSQTLGERTDDNPYGVDEQQAVQFQLMDEDPSFRRIVAEYNKALKIARLDPNDLYHRSAGEVESRTVQKRRDMTADERRARPPWLDYDVPEDQQIVRFGNSGPAYSFGTITSPDANITAYTEAVVMAKRGASPRDIWDATGWFKDKTGKWRFEKEMPEGVQSVAEARAHAQRMQMTPEQRRAIPPWEPVAEEEDIFARARRIYSSAEAAVRAELQKPNPRLTASKNGVTAVLTRSMDGSGGFRITSFSNGEPIGHRDYQNDDRGIKLATQDMVSQGLKPEEPKPAIARASGGHVNVPSVDQSYLDRALAIIRKTRIS